MTPTKELRELLERATVGPWFQGHGTDHALWNGDAESRHKIWPDDSGRGQLIARTGRNFTGWTEEDDDNAALIVAAVNALPGLLDRVEEMEGALEPFATFPLVGKSGGELVIVKGLFTDMKGWRESPPRAAHLHKDDFLRARAALGKG